MTFQRAPKSSLEMRNLICGTAEPLVIKDVLKWELLKWNLDKWTTILSNEELPFRCGKNNYTKEPQFENTTTTIQLTFKEFLKYQEENPHEWLYFDYKYLKDWLTNRPEFKNHINWKDFGFPELDFEDSTIWVGSKGAHTPCHVDTYGCNIIAQVYGRKRWILFPPDEDLQPTRIPYEESSIYSKLNFFTPSYNNFKGIKSCRTVVLNPGDVLILPHKWWHYVENVDLAISVNTWIKLPVDYEERLGESIVRLLLSQVVKQLNPGQLQVILNPVADADEQNSLTEDNVVDLIAIVLTCLSMYKATATNGPGGNIRLEDVLKKFPNIKVVERLSDESFKMLLEIQKTKFDYKVDETIDIEKVEEEKLKKVIDAVIHRDVVNVIKEKLLEI